MKFECKLSIVEEYAFDFNGGGLVRKEEEKEEEVVKGDHLTLDASFFHRTLASCDRIDQPKPTAGRSILPI